MGKVMAKVVWGRGGGGGGGGAGGDDAGVGASVVLVNTRPCGIERPGVVGVAGS